MPLEGPPEATEKKEQESITDEQCLEAMRAGNFETVSAWRQEQERSADENQEPQGRLNVELRYAKLQVESGLIDDDTGESYAIPTLEAVRDAYGADQDQQAWEVQDLIDKLRKK